METKNYIVASLLFIGAFLTASADGKEQWLTPDDSDLIPELDCVIEPSEIVDVGSAVPGVVQQILVERSDVVKKGSVVARLESSVEEASLDLAKVRARMDAAVKLRQQSAAFGHLTQRRNQDLLEKSAISEQVMDQVKTETRIAELQVQQEKDNKRVAGLEYQRAKAILERRTIRTPVDGVVMDRFKSVGEYVEDEPVLRVAQLDPLHVEVIVPVDYLGRVKSGMQAKVTAVVPGSETQLATIDRVDMVSDAASGTFGVRLCMPNPDYAIPAGLRCRIGFMPPGSNNKLPEVCYSVGPITDLKLAQQLTSRLKTHDADLVMHNESVDADITQYWMELSLESGCNLHEQIEEISALLPSSLTLNPIACTAQSTTR